MPGHFISYSSADGQEFALRLRDALEAGPPSLPVWLDRRDIKAGQDWEEAITQAIRDCQSFIFVMTRDSVAPGSGCKSEWACAMRYGKPIVPLKLHPDAETPFGLAPSQHIDFMRAQESEEEFNAALARLRTHLAWLASPAGALQSLRARLADAQRKLRREQDPDRRAQLASEVARLEQDIARRAAAPPAAEARLTDPAHAAPPATKPKSKVRVLVVVAASLALYTAGVVAVVRRAPSASEVVLPPKEKVLAPKMVPIPGGTFKMGSPKKETGHKGDEWQCEVRVAPFSISEHEVTQAQWESVMPYNPSAYKDPNHPVENVSWDEAVEYCKRLSRIFGKHYRLPTEAEWEYAARGNAEKPAPFAFGETLTREQANFGRHYGRTTPVKHFNQPKGFGLYDMHGNVYEWVADDYPRRSASDCLPSSRAGESNVRVLRGGSWASPDVDCRSAGRFWIWRPQAPNDLRSRPDFGFRIAESVEQ